MLQEGVKLGERNQKKLFLNIRNFPSKHLKFIISDLMVQVVLLAIVLLLVQIENRDKIMVMEPHDNLTVH